MIVVHPLCYEDKTDGGSNIAEAADMMTVTAKRQTGVSASGCRHVCEWQFPSNPDSRDEPVLEPDSDGRRRSPAPFAHVVDFYRHAHASNALHELPGWRSSRYEHDVTGNSQ